MSALLLAVALAAAAQPPADVLMASVGEVGAAAPEAEVVEPVACAARAQVSPEELPAVGVVGVVRAEAEEIPSVGDAEKALAEAEEVPPVGGVAQSETPILPVWLPARGHGGCGAVTLYTRGSFLSGPWSAARRLKAARLRGDAAEVRRMEAKLDELMGAALMVEKGGMR